MPKNNKWVWLIVSMTLAGCGQKETAFSALQEALKPTETSTDQRTEKWYADQKNIRDTVLQVCLDYFSQKAIEKGGMYEVEFNENVFAKFTEFPDCIRAREGEILSMTTGKVPLYDYQIANIEQELAQPQKVEQIDQLAADVARRLDQREMETQAATQAGLQQLEQQTQQNGTIQQILNPE